MKIWVDDLRPAPPGYEWCKSVNQAISLIKASDEAIERCMLRGNNCFHNRDYAGRDKCYAHAAKWDIELIDIDHDAGDYAHDGGDYIKLLDWLEAEGKNYPIRIHTMNSVGRQNMRMIIQRNGWKEVR